MAPIRSPYAVQRKAAPPQQFADIASMFQQFLKLYPEVQRMHQEMLAEKGKTHQLIANVKQGPVGPRGFDGNHGSTPALADVVNEVLKRIPKPKDGKTIVGPKGMDGISADPVAIVEKIKKDKLLKAEHVDGWQDPTEVVRRFMANGGIRGGGDTVAAGSGVSISNSNGVKTISVSSSSTNVRDEVPSGSGTAFTLAHTPVSGTLQLFRGGARQQVGAGKDYTISGASITLANTLNVSEILLADYAY